ncbi:hypothetical protein V8E51_018812 [Hyaloscypha variabilis]|uniref:Chitin-binding type-1 domain-containing protein n=1 Tax=Hyaloscypha variabilis (strain UAMH 11265 / GT02V1 / F) TaxID=1149755 RepID=A0A2J6R827_HYAVF|nr:hypothetical protein L207DRAFT_638198 [Hyaloscypha variabilis F]
MLLYLVLTALNLLPIVHALPGTLDQGLQSVNGSNIPSVDGTCGAAKNYTCTGSTYGPCCSSYDFCGNTTAHCLPSHGCQAAYGECTANPGTTTTPTVDGQCGGYVTCAGSAWDGACCDRFGFCTEETEYCLVDNGCQKGLGQCFQSSPDGTCGGTHNEMVYICKDSPFGVCCSEAGYCGSDSEHCGLSCQGKYGPCLAPSPDGTCSWERGFTCLGSEFGDCCSGSSWCGNSTQYCSVAAGCNAGGIDNPYLGVCTEP